MKGLLLLYLLFKGVLLFDALAWEVRMPKDIHGFKGSCLVIPCSYYYSSNPPQNPRRVVWYQWVSWGYPLVYDPLYPKYVIKKFKGKTDLFGNSSWDCSLLIKNLDQVHHGEALYAWIDPENVSWRTYKFYDVTSTILVDASPPQPSIKIYGGVQMGDTITVVCSTLHKCPYSKPNITLNNIEGSDETDSEHIEDGLWKFSLTRTSVTNAENLTIECTVTYYGGITVTAMKSKNAQSPGDEETDVPVPLKPDWLYILVPSLVCILACILAGVIIYKSRHRQTPGDVQGSEQRVLVSCGSCRSLQLLRQEISHSSHAAHLSAAAP
ncbi:hypothetical protein G5714_012266 [Onychostoma macrolepis]|uniref:Uncharacterized protein n=2 Tax=Onychostoma macrolepis TaxID=369639 RepID=A0A7J6CGM5_9TELE|nr:hypothetical protein G5714_012266 [Onychostoma macrolepis]